MHLIIGDKYVDDDIQDKKALQFQNFESEFVTSINKITISTAREKVFAFSYSSIESGLI